MWSSQGTCALCCSLGTPQVVCTTCTHQQVLQEQGVLAKMGLCELLPLKAFLDLICQGNSCSRWFGSGNKAIWKM